MDHLIQPMANECKNVNCRKQIDTDRTFCSQTCYAIWSLETENKMIINRDTRQPKPVPEICKVNSLLGSVNSEFN